MQYIYFYEKGKLYSNLSNMSVLEQISKTRLVTHTAVTDKRDLSQKKAKHNTPK